jgi:hypothetical protein
MLIVYDTRYTSYQMIHEYVINKHTNIVLSPTHETKQQIKLLDLQIIRKPNKLEIEIYRKPATTDTTVNYTLNHPTKHELAAYRYYITRMLSPPLTPARQKTEWNTINTIAMSISFPIKILTNLKSQIQQKIHTKMKPEPQRKQNEPSSHTAALR